MKRYFLFISLFAITMLYLAPEIVEAEELSVSSYPGYGKIMDRSLGTSCQTCHTLFPKLKGYGRRVKEIGYNIPEYELDEEDKEMVSKFVQFYRKIPVALRAKIDFLNDDAGSDKSTDRGVRELQFISAGNLLENKLTWWVHTHIGEDNKLSNPFTSVPHELWLQYNRPDKLNVRIGMFELPLWFAFSKTKLTETDYLLYSATGLEDNPVLLSVPQFGLQINGSTGGSETAGLNYAFALTNGETNFRSTNFKNVFGRITKKGARSTIGMYTYFGSRPVKVQQDEMDMDMDMDHDDAEDGHETDMDSDRQTNRFFRIGSDFDYSLNEDNINLYSSLIYGRDQTDFIGGFLGFDRFIKNRLMFTLRYDLVRFFNPGEDGHDDHGDGDMDDDHGDGDMDDDHGDGDMDDDHGGGDMGGHLHSTIIKSNADAFSLGAHYLLYRESVRIGFDYRLGINGVNNKIIFGLQFAF